MHLLKSSINFFVSASVLFLFGCNESATISGKKQKETSSVATNRDTFSLPTYNPAMDPEKVGAQFYKKLGDTLNIKFYEYTLEPGDSSALHFHPDHSYYVLQGGKLALTIQGKDRRVIELKPGTGGINGPLSDIIVNVGNTTVKLLVTDIYRPRADNLSFDTE